MPLALSFIVKQWKKEQVWQFLAVVQLIHRLMLADISCTNNGSLVLFSTACLSRLILSLQVEALKALQPRERQFVSNRRSDNVNVRGHLELEAIKRLQNHRLRDSGPVAFQATQRLGSYQVL